MPGKKAKRTDDRYMVTLSIGRDANGKIKRKYFYGKTQKEANAKKKAYLEEQESGIVQGKIDLKEWVEAWVKSSSSSERVRRSNTIYAKKLLEAFKDYNMKDIRMIDIKIFAQSMSGYSFSMVKKIKSVTNRIFQDAVRNRLIQFNPCDGVTWDNAGKGTHRAIEDWEKKLIIENYKAHRVGIWAILMLLAGLRRGEALALEWNDVDFDNNCIHVNKAIVFEGNRPILSSTKTKAGIRDVPLLPQLREALMSCPDKNGIICKTAEEKHVSLASFVNGWNSWMKTMENILNEEKTGNQDEEASEDKNDSRKVFSIRTHDLRHTFCTMLYRAGIGLKEAQYIMGHVDTRTTLEIYTHLDETQKKKAAMILAAFKEVY